MSTVLVTGANRGLGLEFVNQYAKAGWRVLACCRNPDTADALKAVEGDIAIHALDVGDFDQMAALAEALKFEPIDVLINNAGIYGPKNMSFGDLDYDAWREVLNIDTLSPLRMAECFIDHVRESELKIIVSVTSKMGSIGDNSSGGSYVYRSAKAGLNAAMKSLAVDLLPQEVTAVVIHPGWVRTDMGGPKGLIDVETSVLGMRTVIDNLSTDQAGMFFNYDGGIIAW